MLKDDILKAGLEIAARFGLAATTRESIAYKVPCAAGSVTYHLGDAKKIRRVIVELAISNCASFPPASMARVTALKVVGWAIAERHPSVQGDKITAPTREEALKVHLGR